MRQFVTGEGGLSSPDWRAIYPLALLEIVEIEGLSIE